MSSNVTADMGRVLAIEPESPRAEALRQLVRDYIGAELVVVTSAYAAVVAINRQVPDVVLFSESIGDRQRDRVLEHLKSTTRVADPQELIVPQARLGASPGDTTSIDPGFAQKILDCIEKAQRARGLVPVAREFPRPV